MDVRTAWRMLTDEQPPDLPDAELRKLYSAKAFSKILSFGQKLEKTIAEHRALMARLDPPQGKAGEATPPTVQ